MNHGGILKKERGGDMLKNIILILNELYIEEITAGMQTDEFVREMESHNWKVFIGPTKDAEQLCIGGCLEESLFISDDKDVLEYLSGKGAYTIACYHKGVAGLMGSSQYAIEGIAGIDADYMEKVYQRYRGIPWHISETNRCRIREMGPEDLNDLYDLYADSRVTQYTEALFADREQERHYIEDYIENIYKYFGFGTWLIHRKEDGVLIGRAGFNYRPGFDEAELGFVIGYPYWRNGYAYEVCSHLLQLGKKVFEFEKIQALADKENTASICLLEKLGFGYAEDVVVDGKEYRRYLYG